MKTKIITLLIMLSVLTPTISYGQTVPFGGRIVAMNECFCSGGWMIWVYDLYTKTTLPLVFQFGISRLNANYNIYTPGVHTLGSYFTGGTCLMVSLECGGGPTPIGTITSFPLPGIGTGLVPG